MNIQAISSISFLPKLQDKNSKIKAENSSNFGLKMAQPLAKDTISFKAVTTKIMGARSSGLTLRDARKIEEMKKPIQEQLRTILDYIFVDRKNIEYISGNAKSAESIAEKSATRGWNTISAALENMTDLNRFKICLANTNKGSVKGVLNTLLPQFKSGNLILSEIEQKVPGTTKFMKANERENYFYATPEVLTKYCETAKKDGHEIHLDDQDWTDTNYSAIHMLIKAPVRNPETGARELQTFELQLMGHDVAVYKELDDLIFKVLNGKNINKKYKELEKILSPLIMPEQLIKMPDKEIVKLGYHQLSEMGCKQELLECEPEELLRRVKERREFDSYRAKVFLTQREKEPLPVEQRGGDDLEFFEPLNSKILPRKYDVNNLYRMMKQADLDALAVKNIDSGIQAKTKTVKPKTHKKKI